MHLKGDLHTGLKSHVAAEKLRVDGRNELLRPPKATFLQLFTMQMLTILIMMLLLAALADLAVTLSGNDRRQGLSYCTCICIFLIIFVNAGIAAWTEYKAGDAMEALAKMSQATIFVVRDGAEVRVDTTSLVRGDVVVLGTGDVVPADMRIFEASDLKVSEMALTGEPDDVAKTTRLKENHDGPEKLLPENMVFSGCPVTSGKAKCLVTDTGMATRIGRIAQLISSSDDEIHEKSCCSCLPAHMKQTPLQVNLAKFGNIIGAISIGVCLIMFIIGCALKRGNPADPAAPAWLYMILVAVTLAVAAIPEGIPLCITIALSVGCKDMVKQNVLIRKIAAVETLGCASVICSDKTGTLTEGKMTMVNLWSGGAAYNVSGKGFDPTVGKFFRTGDQEEKDCRTEVGIQSTLMAALMCCNTTLSKVVDEKDGREKWEPKGNSSEAPIVVAARKVGITDAMVAEHQRIMEVPFSSARKMMLTVSDVSGKASLCQNGMAVHGSKFAAVVKGAPNFIIEYCTEMLNQDGTVVPLTDQLKAECLGVVDKYSDQALRVLAVAVRLMPELPFDPQDEDVSTETKFEHCRKSLRLLGLVAAIDPPRPGVKESVQVARMAGVRVVMITGDYVKTAIAIGRNVDILQESDDNAEAAVDCQCLRPTGDYIGNHEMDVITQSVRVFARARPEDKLQIVKSLQRQGFVTAMTGDGVNDAPALNQADIGVAMGIQGTEVAKGASHMILLDDNFCSIVSAVHKGRTVYAGIQKFVAFIMSVHIAEILQIFICVVAGIPVMRTPLLILFLILVTDLPPSIALGLEPGEAILLKQPPRPKTEPICLGWMWFSVIMNGLNLCVVIMFLYLASLRHYCNGDMLQADIIAQGGDYEINIYKARTVAFISLVWADNLRCYTARSFTQYFYIDFFSNSSMQWAVSIAQVSLYIGCFVPVISDQILGLYGMQIGIWGWAVSLGGPAMTLVLCEGLKRVTRILVFRHQRSLEKTRQKLAIELVGEGAAQLEKEVSGIRVWKSEKSVKSAKSYKSDRSKGSKSSVPGEESPTAMINKERICSI